MSDAAETLPNFSLREEIKDYWGKRAETFDTQPGHEIFSEEERAAWHALFKRHLGPGADRKALDLASGTGVISHLLDDLGFQVTGLDWAEPMLQRARDKARSRKRDIRFIMGDAERTLEDPDTYEVITCRHLVWTLVDPEAAFREWLRILKPGGQLLVVDGDFVNPGLMSRMVTRVSALLARLSPQARNGTGHKPADMMETHRSILARVYFSGGARAQDVAALLQQAGFTDIRIDTDLRRIHKTQARNFSFLKGLERATQHRYAISARKPV